MRLPPKTSTFVTLALLMTVQVGCAPKREKSTIAPPPTTGQRAFQVIASAKNAVLPPPTITAAEVRAALWDIDARQWRGEAAAALADYNDRAEALKTLESRYLAAAAIPDSESAWTAFKAIANEQPTFYWAHAGMASVYIEWGIRDQAENELNLAAELAPGISFTHTLRGDLSRRLGDHDQAVRHYLLALQSDDKDADARTGLALSRRAQGKTESFEQDLTRALKDVATHYEAAQALAPWFDEKDDRSAALSAWERVARLAPKNRNALLALARLRTDGDAAGAAAAYEAAARLQSLAHDEEQSLARLYRTLGRGEDEAESVKRLTRLAPNDVAHWRRLAELQSGSGDTAALEKTFGSILSIDDKDVPALLGLAAISETNARILDALGFLERARLAKSAVAKEELARLAEACLLPQTPISATNLTRYYRKLSESLEKLYTARLAATPGLTGRLKVRITTDGRGKALDAEVLENSLEDPWLEAHLVYAVLGSKLPAVGSGQGRFVLDFDLPPIKQ